MPLPQQPPPGPQGPQWQKQAWEKPQGQAEQWRGLLQGNKLEIDENQGHSQQQAALKQATNAAFSDAPMIYGGTTGTGPMPVTAEQPHVYFGDLSEDEQGRRISNDWQKGNYGQAFGDMATANLTGAGRWIKNLF